MGSGAQAQQFKVIHNFQGLGDGSEATYGMTIDSQGNLYSTTFDGNALTGNVYKLTNRNGNWVETPLYNFPFQDPGGSIPYDTVIQGKDGTLYGTAAYGGNVAACPNGQSSGCGAVFSLRPLPVRPPTPLAQWNYTPLHVFNKVDGANPYGGDLLIDSAGNIYGTTYNGGTGNCTGGCGVVFELSPAGGGNWTYTVLYNFNSGSGDGIHPWAGVIMDPAGNLYGTTAFGGAHGDGTIYQLSPSSSGWTEQILYSFSGSDGSSPYAGLVFDSAENLYGATVGGGVNMGGTVFELTPGSGGWTLKTLYALVGNGGQQNRGPFGRIILLKDGTIYAAAAGDGLYNFGSVFKLTPGSGGYTYTSLHDFTSGLDGGYARTYLVMDSSGNLYGSTINGGTGNSDNCTGPCGVVYEITP